MPFTEEDKILIKHYRQDLGYTVTKLLRSFPGKGWTEGGLKYFIAKIDATGTIERKKGSGRPRSVRVPENIAIVSELCCSQEADGDEGTHESPREIEHLTGISRSSVVRIIKNDLRLNNFGRSYCKKLSERERTLRVSRGKRLARYMTIEKLNRTFFSDEKNFKVGHIKNRKNDRFYTTANKKRDVPETRLLRQVDTFPKKIMISAAISKLGKSSIIFVESGIKINKEVYLKHLKETLIPEMKKLGGRNGYVFQQDGATSHTAKVVLDYLEKKVPEFLPPDLWPPSSPDLNPLDYGIWSILENNVYKVKIRDMDHLKSRILQCWEEIDQDVINKTIDSFRMRLKKMNEVDGRRFEHLLI